jgi:hypothetical protein
VNFGKHPRIRRILSGQNLNRVLAAEGEDRAGVDLAPGRRDPLGQLGPDAVDRAQIARRRIEHGRGGAKAVAERFVQPWANPCDQRQLEGIVKHSGQRLVQVGQHLAVAGLGGCCRIPRRILLRHLASPP